MNFNNSSANFTTRYLQGSGSIAASGNLARTYLGEINYSTRTTSTSASVSIYIPNYSGSSQKSFSIDTVTEANSGASESALAALLAGLWSDSSAITYIKLTPWSSQTFLQYTTATLYGIKNS